MVCDLPITDGFPSTTFGLNGTLYGSNNTDQTLDIIDPCTCEVTEVGPTNGGGDVLFVGITAAADNGLMAVDSSNDNVQLVSPDSGETTLVGSLGVNFQSSGATWSEADQLLYAINAGNDALFSIDPGTGAASLVVDLSRDFLSVGITEHPGTGVVYACDTDGVLYTVDTSTGDTAEVGSITGASCNNLAAPFAPVDCISNP